MMASNTDSNIVLSVGLQKLPDLLIRVLPYIADRTVFNSIASCNKDTNEKSKLILPPWPKDYRLPASDGAYIAVWSPDGTRVAYNACRVITIIDQRYGIIHRINNNRGVNFCDFKFSPDGRFLVSADQAGIVKLWNNDVVGNYEQLQRWEFDVMLAYSLFVLIDISACSKYIVAVTGPLRNCVVLIGVENSEIIRSLTPQPVMNYITEAKFTVDCRVVFLFGRQGNSSVIKLWRPYLNNTDEHSLVTLWELETFDGYPKITVSHDKMMIVIQYVSLNKGWLVSTDNKYSCTVQKFGIQATDELLQFTPDDKYIIYATTGGLSYWSVAGNKFTDKEYVLYNGRNGNILKAVNYSPNNRQLIVRGAIQGEGSLYMKSMFGRRKIE